MLFARRFNIRTPPLFQDLRKVCEEIPEAGFFPHRKNRGASGLFPVLNGATTVWEHWDSWTPEKGFKDPEMNSFNHYAYGAVLDWIIKDAAGIAPDFNIDPHPGGTLSYLDVTYRGVRVRWEKENDKYLCLIDVPEGIIAKFRGETLSVGEHRYII